MTFFFIPWRPAISRFAQNAAHHSCSSVFKASVGCRIFPHLDAQTVDARKPLPTTTTGHLRIAKKAIGPTCDSQFQAHRHHKVVNVGVFTSGQKQFLDFHRHLRDQMQHHSCDFAPISTFRIRVEQAQCDPEVRIPRRA
jgi:hypothetical protein